MEMKVRGWREERVVWATSTTGGQVPIVTGRTTYEGRDVAAIAIGNGPSAILDGDSAQLRVNIAATTDDARRAGR